jgi:hypothetical protein
MITALRWIGDAMDSVQQALADYDGDNVWDDVILRLDGFNRAATALLKPVCAGPVFVVGGIGYQWCPDLGHWQSFDAASEIAHALTDPLIAGIAALMGRRFKGRNRKWWRRALRSPAV